MCLSAINMTFISRNIYRTIAGVGICTIVGMAIFLIVISAQPKPASAIIACAAAKATSAGKSAANQATAVSVTNADIESSTNQQSQVECLYKGLAAALVKIALQKMTSDLVNWINSGFEGNPAFPTNPGAMMLDFADQVSGEFLSNQGALSQLLCSPFSLDVRLSIALNLQSNRRQYACTLSNIYNNAKNGPSLTVNGKSIQGFVNGDFNQGGWPAFLEMTTNPANNVYGSYIMADSDIRQAIALKQNSVQADIAIGGGYMSWTKCTDTKTYAPDSREAGPYNVAPPGSRRVVNKDKSVTYQTCTVETPGSFIGASLTKQFGSSVDQIVNIRDIDEAVSQVASALIVQTLKTGLAAATKDGSSSNGRGSLIDELTHKENKDQLRNTQEKYLDGLQEDMDRTTEYATMRQQAVDVLVAERQIYATASACYASKFDLVTAASIDKIITKSDKEIGDYRQKIDTSPAALATLIEQTLDLQYRIEQATSTESLKGLRAERAQLSGDTAIATNQNVRNARNNLARAQSLAEEWHVQATNYLNACNAMSTSTPTTQ